MARTIGKVKIRKLKGLILKTIKESDAPKRIFIAPFDWIGVKEKIIEKVPSDWFDTWESAWAEINRIVDDGIREYIYG